MYQSPPHITADNHFSGDNIMKFMGGKGYGFTVTCHRDCFPVGIKLYLYQEKIKAGNKMAKAMRYDNPIEAVRLVEVTNEDTAYTENTCHSSQLDRRIYLVLTICLHFSYM
jgi:hypothetical protein